MTKRERDLSPDGDRYDFSNPFISVVIETEDGQRVPLWTHARTQRTTKGKKKAVGIGERLPSNLISNQDIANIDDDAADNTTALTYVSEVRVELQLAYLPRITAILTPPYKDAILFLDSNLMNWGTSFLEVQFGYVSNTSSNTILSPVFRGLMLKPEVQLGADAVITLTAQGLGGLWATRESGTRVFNNQTREHIINLIARGDIANPKLEDIRLVKSSFNAKEYLEPVEASEFVPLSLRSNVSENRLPVRGSDGFVFTGLGPLDDADIRLARVLGEGAVFGSGTSPNRANTPSTRVSSDESRLRSKNKVADSLQRDVFVDYSDVHNSGDAQVKAAIFDTPINYSQAGKSDWRAIWELCMEARCYWFWEGNTLKIIPQSSLFAGEQPKRYFRLYDYPGGEIGPYNGYFPIISASSPTMAVYLPGSLKNLHQADVSDRTRKAVKKNTSDSTVKKPRLEEGGVAPSTDMGATGVDVDTGDGGSKFPGDPSDPSAVALAEAELVQQSSGMGINLVVETLADPKILPGQKINVRGLGTRLSGTYAILDLSWTFNLSGSTMTLECVKDVVAALSGRIAGKGAQFKTEDEPEDTSKDKKEAVEE